MGPLQKIVERSVSVIAIAVSAPVVFVVARGATNIFSVGYSIGVSVVEPFGEISMIIGRTENKNSFRMDFF